MIEIGLIAATSVLFILVVTLAIAIIMLKKDIDTHKYVIDALVINSIWREEIIEITETDKGIEVSVQRGATH